ncbi:MAG: Smr/MutS family protein [Candidatus Magasanikbacteria bacterium]|nr:Smr/MutS family protein [Candidatus Magasanikbacteria bacterium]MCA9389068.1 Smr/MutS family protein [Candidatus Magasanikbacteria bacterium]MCA9391278.1 Smr/MutS family protein [Candidatus Magasanikbacteria bacterium]USN52746.1 MAG: Smr/MutS family protein [Candidatus Nomurabacteria bacterium]HPF95426.1 Smr/MutS family protein [bacterium]
MNQDIHAQLFAAEIGDVPELDIHGLSVHMAIKELEDFIGRESGRKTSAIRVICGHGTGALFTGITHFLQKPHPLIAAWRPATAYTNSTGAIIVIALYS